MPPNRAQQNFLKRALVGALAPFYENRDPEEVKRELMRSARYGPIAGGAMAAPRYLRNAGEYGGTALATLANLASELTTGKPVINSPYLERASTRVETRDQQLRDVVGVGQVENLADLVPEVLGSLAVGGPVKSGAQVARQAPRLEKIIRGVPQAVAEVALPFRQSRYLPAAAVSVPAVGAITEGLDAGLNVGEYRGIPEIVGGAAPQQEAANDDPYAALPTVDMSPEDLHHLVLTTIGEAQSEDAMGKQAVASVILNRAEAHGGSVIGTVLAKNQFEPWNNRRTTAHLNSIDPSSQLYQDTLAAIMPVVNGEVRFDYDHFYAPRAQAALAKRDGRPPVARFDNGTGTDIGRHRFFQLGYRGQGTGQHRRDANIVTAGFGASVVGNDQTQDPYANLPTYEIGPDGKMREIESAEPIWNNPLVVAGAMAATGLGLYGASRTIRNMRNARAAVGPSLTGVRQDTQVSGRRTRATAGAVQADQPIREVYKKSGMTDDEIDLRLAGLDSVTAASLNRRVQYHLDSGDLPKSSVRTQPLGVLLESSAKELTPAERTVLEDGLLAKSALDDFDRTHVQSSFNAESIAGLRAKAARVDSDPKLSKYAELIRQSNRDMLDFLHDRGKIGTKMHTEFRKARPNYVHFSKARSGTDDATNVIFGPGDVPGSMRAHLNDILARSDEEWGGIQVGEAASPLTELPSQWAAAIRRAEIDDEKIRVLELAASLPDYKNHVKHIGTARPNKMDETIHDVVINGVQHYYRVTDPALAHALRFSPNSARSGMAMAFVAPSRFMQFWTTGPGAPIFAPISAFYDGATSIMLRRRDMDLGVTNEILNRTGIGPAIDAIPGGRELRGVLSSVDPTSIGAGFVGAVRKGLLADLPQAFGKDLAGQLLRNDGWMIRMIGPQHTAALEARLAAGFDGGVKSLLNETGGGTTNLFASAEPTQVSAGMAQLAPKFATETAWKAYRDALSGNVGEVEAAFRHIPKAVAVSIRAAPLSRLYMGVAKLLHEGSRYQYVATNAAKFSRSADDMSRLGSRTRRSAADVAQTGSGKLPGDFLASFPYANVALQTLAEVGRRSSTPAGFATTAMNVGSFLAAATALQYGTAALDPEGQRELRERTDEENAKSIWTPIGEIPIPPELRLLWAPWTALLNEITGINYGVFNPDLVDVFEAWGENGYSLSENGQFSIQESMKYATNSAVPLPIFSSGENGLELTPGALLGANPLTAGLASSMGVDVGLSRFTGEPQTVRTQKFSALGGEGKLSEDALSATWQAFIEDIGGTTIANFMRAGLDAQRVLTGDEKGNVYQAARVAASRMKDQTVKGAGPTRELLFKDYDRVRSINDTDFRLWQTKRDGIEQAKAVLDQNLLQQFVTGADPRYAELRSVDVVPPSIQGTALSIIGAAAAELEQAFTQSGLPGHMQTWTEQANVNIPNQKLTSIENRNTEINEVNEKRKWAAQQLLWATQNAESYLRHRLQDPTFSFTNLDVEKYRTMPLPPEPPVGAQASSPQP